MDIQAFTDAAVNGIPLLFVVAGLVQVCGMFGAAGKVQLACSLLIGLALGIGYQIAQLGVPVGFAGWFAASVFGLGLGIVASGLYETAKKLTTPLRLPT
jgi:hypothetical protein